MAKSPKPTPAAKTPEPITVPDVATLTSYPSLRGVLTTSSPANRLDVDRKDQLRRLLERLHDAIDEFVAGQLDKGLTEEEVITFLVL